MENSNCTRCRCQMSKCLHRLNVLPRSFGNHFHFSLDPRTWVIRKVLQYGRFSREWGRDQFSISCQLSKEYQESLKFFLYKYFIDDPLTLPFIEDVSLRQRTFRHCSRTRKVWLTKVESVLPPVSFTGSKELTSCIYGELEQWSYRLLFQSRRFGINEY